MLEDVVVVAPIRAHGSTHLQEETANQRHPHQHATERGMRKRTRVCGRAGIAFRLLRARCKGCTSVFFGTVVPVVPPNHRRRARLVGFVTLNVLFGSLLPVFSTTGGGHALPVSGRIRHGGAWVLGNKTPLPAKISTSGCTHIRLRGEPLCAMISQGVMSEKISY